MKEEKILGKTCLWSKLPQRSSYWLKLRAKLTMYDIVWSKIMSSAVVFYNNRDICVDAVCSDIIVPNAKDIVLKYVGYYSMTHDKNYTYVQNEGKQAGIANSCFMLFYEVVECAKIT